MTAKANKDPVDSKNDNKSILDLKNMKYVIVKITRDKKKSTSFKSSTFEKITERLFSDVDMSLTEYMLKLYSTILAK